MAACANSGRFIFGQGDIYTTPNVKNPTPIKVATPQSLDLSFSGDVATVFGNKSFAKATASTTKEVTGTITLAEAQPEFISRYLLGGTKRTGRIKQIEDIVELTSSGEPAAVKYVAADFNKDLGVVSRLQVRFERVESNPQAYQYSLDEETGTYTFNATQAGVEVYIRYNQLIEDSGETYVLKNTLMGSLPSFRLETTGLFQGAGYAFIFYNCTATSYSQSTTNDGFALPTFEFSASVDCNDELGEWQVFDYDVE